ncbi:MAG: hypothetical protein U1E54_04275 [Candidatus Levybacteria bacterium]|nr:hypothetical protein [Candidatus Levybacteria bacterium]
MNKTKDKTNEYISHFATLLNIIGIVFVFVSVWVSGWNIVRFFVTGILLMAWGLGIFRSQKECQIEKKNRTKVKP